MSIPRIAGNRANKSPATPRKYGNEQRPWYSSDHQSKANTKHHLGLDRTTERLCHIGVERASNPYLHYYQGPCILRNKVVDSVVATRDRILRRKSDSVQMTIRDTHTANELVDIHDMFLMGFGCKNDRGAPCAKIFADPAVGFEDFELLHDDLTFVWTP